MNINFTSTHNPETYKDMNIDPVNVHRTMLEEEIKNNAAQIADAMIVKKRHNPATGEIECTSNLMVVDVNDTLIKLRD